ncbi:hypothetical protein FKP32DRAFT_1567403 [Trametes sanguinea]|nr:hypothetical protein FKP32DRAFT_1567403 [Trametes sanguinea]
MVATVLGEGTTPFEEIRAEQTSKNESEHAPFRDEEEWELVRWLLRSTSQSAIDEYCKLRIISLSFCTGYHQRTDLGLETRNRTQLSFKNKKAFFRAIDKMPVGPEWHCDIITVTGDLNGPNGEPLTEELESWWRDPVECCRELLGNPALKDYIAYSPVKIRRDGVRFYGEMNTADWWHDTQPKLPEGAVIAPVILASDKTTLTVLRGDQTAWPVYLSLGNIDKAVRRKPSAHAVVLLGYIPVSKGHCYSKAARSEAMYRLFHRCMAKMLEALIEAGRSGVDMTCADGLIRRVFPILAAYIADHPEQCLIACCKENRCPRCLVPSKRRGERREWPLRSQAATADVLQRFGEGENPPEYKDQGLRPVYKPFWADLPHTDIFSCITPDILHQIHKGVIQSHLLQWCEKIVGKEALDERFAAMSQAHGLRHFHRGISVISQWTGAEAKEIEKILLGMLVGRVNGRTLKAIRALLDFTYYAQYEVHSDTTLALMRSALETFHRNKVALIELGVREHFNIPKLHSLIHYVEAIMRVGCLDGLNTENSERLHIDLAKKAYRASSRREYFAQMTTWLQRQEAVERRAAYLCWIQDVLHSELEEDRLGVDEYRPGEEVVEVDDGGQDEDQPCDPKQVEDEVKALRQLLNSNVARAYQLPLTPTNRRASLESLAMNHGAVDLLTELNYFLHNNAPPSIPTATSSIRLDVYHSVTILLPANIHIANQKRLCKLRAAPSKPRMHDRKEVPAHFDCALFIGQEDLNRVQGSLEALRPGQVRVIFRLPEWMGFSEPLVYVHWFRPFHTTDPIAGLPSTSHSTRFCKRNATVVLLRDILRTCHLVPKFGQTDVARAGWKAQDILDEPSLTFMFNRYYDFHTFQAFSASMDT